ncbi:MAG: hypothetical protein WDO14_24280 [Bacteroidota bacterium]
MIKDQNRLKYLDAACLRLAGSFVEVPLEKIFKDGLSNIKTRDGIKPNLHQAFQLRQGDKIWWCENGKRIGLEKSDHEEFLRIVRLIYEDHSVKPYISFEFILTRMFQCMIDVRHQDNRSTIVSTNLCEEMASSITSYNVYLRLIHLKPSKKITIGEVEIGRFKPGFFDKQILAFKRRHGDIENIYEIYKDIFSNQAYAKVYVRAESQRAKEIASEKCSLTLDLLKVCSQTVVHPKSKVNFDLDRNVRIHANQSVLLENLEYEHEITAQIERAYGQDHELAFDIEEYNKRGLQALVQLLSKFPTEKDRSELQRITMRAIQKLASALSEPNFHRRVTDLFTVLESLLLKDQNSPIIESVGKYLSKLVFKTLEERKECITLLKKMYAVRSAYLHHAHEAPIELVDLASLQVCVYSLVFKMITKSLDYKTKEELFEEIDEAIIAAYTPKIFREQKRAK